MIDWLKMWPILVTLAGLVGAAFTLKADVDAVKSALGEAGTLPIIQMKLEQLGERSGKMEVLMEKQVDERNKMMDVIRSGQTKIDNLVELLLKERERQERAGRK